MHFINWSGKIFIGLGSIRVYIEFFYRWVDDMKIVVGENSKEIGIQIVIWLSICRNVLVVVPTTRVVFDPIDHKWAVV